MRRHAFEPSRNFNCEVVTGSSSSRTNFGGAKQIGHSNASVENLADPRTGLNFTVGDQVGVELFVHQTVPVFQFILAGLLRVVGLDANFSFNWVMCSKLLSQVCRKGSPDPRCGFHAGLVTRPPASATEASSKFIVAPQSQVLRKSMKKAFSSGLGADILLAS